MPNTCASIESLRAPLSRNTPIPTGRVSVLPEDEINDDDSAETQVHEEARGPDDEDEDEHADDSTIREGEDLEEEMTSCQRSPKTTKMRCLNRTGCYLNSYLNNKPNVRRREPE